MHVIFVLLILIIGSFSFTSPVEAQSCKPIYGGGVTEEQYCPTPTPLGSTQQNTQPRTNQNTTKGGLPVNKPATTTTTPDTGPAALGLLALVPAGLLGIYLRQKA